MLPKKSRLKKASEIDNLFHEGNTVKGNIIICRFKENNLKKDRPCFVIAKKLKLTTVKKNRLRRQMAHAYKDALRDYQKKIPCTDSVFILKKVPGQEQNRYEQIKQDLTEIFKKIKCRNES